jgi:uncharacterized coiled-coil DUF342 family protein
MKLLSIDTIELLQWGLVPVSSVITWLVSTRKRRNDTLASIQQTVDLLVNKNHELVEKLTAANAKIAEQSEQIAAQSKQIAEQSHQISAQSEKITELTKKVDELQQEKNSCKDLLLEFQRKFDKQ